MRAHRLSWTNTATYSYLANSALAGQIGFAQSGTTRMTTAKQYDNLNRLSSVVSTPSISFSYLYNQANQRTMNRLADGSYWSYNYDSLGQVTQGNRYWNDFTPVAGQQFDYAFDTIGNRTQTQAGGDQNGVNLRVASYTNNALNQITSRDFPGYMDVMGDGLATNGVTVNGVAATGQTSVTGSAFLPKTPESYAYDADGNLLSDGRWTNVWDAENRLVSMTSVAGAPSGSLLKLQFSYDYQGRRIQKLVSTNNGSSYVGKYTNIFVYDGWNLIAEASSAGALIRSYTWGTDLSGSQQGAGGVAGLMIVGYHGTGNTNTFIAYDGNGNVSAQINVNDGSAVANYDYGPFGEVIRKTGQMATFNPIRFSSKYDDDESDFLYYGHRYYNPSTGRWLSRDPIGEQGGVNLFAASGNDLLDQIDVLGLRSTTLTLFGNYAGFGNGGLTPDDMLDVINGPDVQGFISGLLSQARSKWTCNRSGALLSDLLIPSTILLREICQGRGNLTGLVQAIGL